MYNVTQCRTPTWPPMCPFTIVEHLISCQIWTCNGEPPEPGPVPPPSPNVQSNTGAVIAVVVSVLVFILLMGIIIYFKQVNSNKNMTTILKKILCQPQV